VTEEGGSSYFYERRVAIARPTHLQQSKHPHMRSIPLLLLTLAACGGGEGNHTAIAQQPSHSTGSAAHSPATPADSAAHRFVADSQIVRALYVNRWAAQSSKRMRDLIAIADSTEINALVIDMKDEFGLNYESADPMVKRNAGSSGHVPQLRALLDTLHAHRILPIARIVVFKDSVAARLNPQHVIRKPDGTPWHDKKGLTWVDPYDRAIWEYDIRVAEEVARMGFGEVQFDYIRFPEPYKSLPQQVFSDANGVSKPKALGEFFRAACPRAHAAGARCTADIFGLVTTVRGPLEIGQEWEELAPHSDVLLPMVYPSHYPHGAFGVQKPNAEPYKIVFTAIHSAHERDLKLGITAGGHVRPWLQAFSLKGLTPKYGAAELQEQKRAVYDAGYDGWTLWSPGSIYEPFLEGLEKKEVSRKKAFPTPR
jgi:hypothetical protein